MFGWEFMKKLSSNWIERLDFNCESFRCVVYYIEGIGRNWIERYFHTKFLIKTFLIYLKEIVC